MSLAELQIRNKQKERDVKITTKEILSTGFDDGNSDYFWKICAVDYKRNIKYTTPLVFSGTECANLYLYNAFHCYSNFYFFVRSMLVFGGLQTIILRLTK